MNTASSEELMSVELFGGAMLMSMPACFKDVSEFRPVPDHQEVSIGWHRCLQGTGMGQKMGE